MIHYTCDGCQRPLHAESDLRYVVRVEVYASLDPVDDESECDRDHLQEIQEILERLDDAESDQIGDDVYQQLRFDLCAECRRRFLRNPLAAVIAGQFHFSDN